MNPSSHQALTSHETDDWYTPESIISHVLDVLGSIDLDPCSPYYDGPVPATNHYIIREDGLTLPWYGRVFMNPPYSDVITWVTKAVQEYESRRVQEAILLTSGGFDTRWWRKLSSFPWCAHHGRIKFNPSVARVKKISATRPSALFYLGNNEERFIEVFSKIGTIYQQVNP